MPAQPLNPPPLWPACEIPRPKFVQRGSLPPPPSAGLPAFLRPKTTCHRLPSWTAPFFALGGSWIALGVLLMRSCVALGTLLEHLGTLLDHFCVCLGLSCLSGGFPDQKSIDFGQFLINFWSIFGCFFCRVAFLLRLFARRCDLAKTLYFTR